MPPRWLPPLEERGSRLSPQRIWRNACFVQVGCGDTYATAPKGSWQ
jgi:hypothetical protein